MLRPHGMSYDAKGNLYYHTRDPYNSGHVQLNTMCGQAFEYYTMYKRAIRQGYGPTDAERTYQAPDR